MDRSRTRQEAAAMDVHTPPASRLPTRRTEADDR